MDPFEGTDPLDIFTLFLTSTYDVLEPIHSVVFWRFVRLGSVTACWRQANVTKIPKGPPSFSVSNYRQGSISVLSKMFERLVLVRLSRFMDLSDVLPTMQFAYRKGLGTCDADL